MKVAGFLVVVLLVASGCATTHVSSARFVSRSPAGGVVATPSAEVGMDDANAMIAAHCGGGGYAITREGEALVGNTVVTEGANSVDAQTTEGSGQVQGHENSKTVFATGSNWQVNYTCNDPRTVNMGLITRSRTTPSKLAWGADVGAGMMVVAGQSMDSPDYQGTRSGSATTIGANAWLGYKLSDKFTMGGGAGVAQVIGMPQWQEYYDSGLQANVVAGSNSDASAIEFFATARYSLASKADMGVRIGISDWNNVSADGSTPFAALQFAYRVLDVGSSGVYVGAGLSSYFSSSLTSNVSPALSVGFH